MTMHLAHPALTTTGKPKGKRKWASAEAKRRAELLQQDWANLKQRNGIKDTPKITAKRTEGNLADTYRLRVPPGRETPYVNSLDTGWAACTRRTDQEYTGTKVKGIGTMHKSNAVPIFSDEEAIDISKMRR
jgi:hypothetical protein